MGKVKTIGPVNLSVVSLDFDSNKNSLKNYLAQQDQFKDFDFEGSSLSILLDVLSNNTHYNAFYANMLNNEAFLDSAVKKDSVVSHAKHIGYLPRSVNASKACVNIIITPDDNPDNIIIERGTKFNSNLDGKTFPYVTTDSYILHNDGSGNYVAENVILTQGRWLTFTYVVDSSRQRQRYIIPNANVDLATLKVSVQNSYENTHTEAYTQVNDITAVEPNDKVYFIDQIENDRYEITFGDGVIGAPVVDGNMIIIEFIVTDAEAANGISIFTPSGNIEGYRNIQVETLVSSIGGAPAEDIESIRWYAPRAYQTQNRAVTPSDYEHILMQDPLVKSVAKSLTVWGGEENLPRDPGSVYICLNMIDQDVSRTMLNDHVVSVLSDKKVLGMTPKIVYPEYLDISVVNTFNYDPRATTLDRNTLEEIVMNSILEYNEQYLQDFGVNFRYSTFSKIIDNADKSIRNNLSVITVSKKLGAKVGVNYNYLTRFMNALKPGSLTSSRFIVNEPEQGPNDVYFLRDDSLGKIQLVKQFSNFSTRVLNEDAGTINYLTGDIVLNSLYPVSFINSTDITINADTAIQDVVTRNNIILRILESNVRVSGNILEYDN